MGAGTGHMARMFLERGFNGVCHDIGESSRQAIRSNLRAFGGRASVVDSIDALPPGAFDYLFAFEVLEHIEDDHAALRQWAGKLREGGRLLASVPAHARKYGRSDVLVGHVRRYERAELHRLLEDCGFDSIRIVNYGFPVTELTRRISNFLVRNDASYEGMSPVERSIRSAQAKPRAIVRWLRFAGESWVKPFRIVQRWSYKLDLGDGYVVTAVKAS
jgi:SAM-dependent methyltransferase